MLPELYPSVAHAARVLMLLRGRHTPLFATDGRSEQKMPGPRGGHQMCIDSDAGERVRARAHRPPWRSVYAPQPPLMAVGRRVQASSICSADGMASVIWRISGPLR